MEVFAVIMAGGQEMRFGPIGKYVGSKKFLELGGNDEILLETVFRCDQIVDSRDNIYVVTNEPQKLIIEKVLKQKKEINTTRNYDFENFIIEPSPCGTAYCILLSALELKKKFPGKDIVMCVFPSDHDIPNTDDFKRTLKKAVALASEKRKMVLIGISPKFPSTAYGYIHYNVKAQDKKYYQVKGFKEKPRIRTAKKYISDNLKLDLDAKHYWNSGIFVWNLDVILSQFEQFLSSDYRRLKKIFDANYSFTQANRELTRIYRSITEKVFIDKAILERAKKESVLVVPGEFSWQDIGKWDALLAYFSNEDGIFMIEIIGVDICNHTVYSNGKHIYNMDHDIAKSFPGNSYIWLYCVEEDREDALNVLKEYKHSNLRAFTSKELVITMDDLVRSIKDEKTKPLLIVEDKERIQGTQGGINIGIDDHSDAEVFISHAEEDKAMVEAIRLLLMKIGIRNNDVFSYAIRGLGVSIGDAFPETIRCKLIRAKIVIFIISREFYNSPYCLNEMGAAWILGKPIIPILVPPVTIGELKGFINSDRIVGQIDTPQDIDGLYDKIVEKLGLSALKASSWNEAKDEYLARIRDIINQNPAHHKH